MMVEVKDIDIHLITTDQEWEEAKRLRVEVFVEEQGVPAEEELDEYEEVARHLILNYKGQPAGTCRWRFTDKGIKMERFVVAKPYRGHGLGGALVKAALKDIDAQEGSKGKTCYLHAQEGAVSLYKRAGFIASGEPFDECGIWHYYMERGNQ